MDRFREYKNESYDEILKKVMFIAKTSKTQPELSKEAIEAIEKARKRIKKGNFLTETEARKRLGLQMYEIIFDDKAIDFLNKLPKPLKERIFNKIISTKEKPFRYFERLTNRKEYKLRVGNYRVIADIDKKLKIIKIRIIMHRKNIYN